MERKDIKLVLANLGQRKLLSLTLVLFTLAIGIVIGTVISGGVDAARNSQRASDAKLLEIPEAVPVENEFSKIAKQVRPSVVNIQVEFRERPRQQSERGARPDESNPEDFFRRFFGMPGGPFRGGPTPPERRRRPGEGSGVIVDENGYIITNNHVVEGADRIRVRLFNGNEKRYDAKLIGTDAETDLAVIKIDVGNKLPAAKIGNSDAIDVGDWAIAVGSPFGFRETVTVGIISAKSREFSVSRPFQKFLQTDAAINPGNSGGPLLNIRGEIIGINTAIVSRTGGYEGLGFSLPSNIAVDVYNQIVQYGKVARGSIGISFQSNQSPALLRSYGAKDGGVLVGEVIADGPSEDAGMKQEDVIIEINGKPVSSGDQLIDVVAATPVDSTVPIVVIRDGERKTLHVKIADRAELFSKNEGLTPGPSDEDEQDAEVVFGFSVSNLSAAEREQLSYEESDGVRVTEVKQGSFADDIGLNANDIVVAINRKPIKRVADIEGAQEGLKAGDDVAVKVMRRIVGASGRVGWTTQYLAGVLPAEFGSF